MSVTQVWRTGEGARRAPRGILKWEDDTSGRYTGK